MTIVPCAFRFLLSQPMVHRERKLPRQRRPWSV
jgi:hypothetical protein